MGATTNKDASTPPFPPSWQEDLIRCFWMAFDGRTQDLLRYVERNLPAWRQRDAGFADGIASLLRKPTSSLTRNVAPTLDSPRFVQPFEASASEADLLRIEDPVQLPIEPVWTDKVAEALLSIIRERQSIPRLLAAGLSPTKTTIFTGPPGVGKTLAARWIARELKLPLASLNLGAVMSSFLGKTGANLRSVMAFASARPCILFLDEIDAVAKRRDDHGDIGELKRLVTVLLQEIDAWPSESLLLAATNHEQLLDPAVWRRFERRVIFPQPGKEQQAQLLSRLMPKEWFSLSENFRNILATAFTILSPSDLTQIVTRALRDVALETGTLEERMEHHLGDAISLLPLESRRQVGIALKKAGGKQRETSRLTGLARETIRGLRATSKNNLEN